MRRDQLLLGMTVIYIEPVDKVIEIYINMPDDV